MLIAFVAFLICFELPRQDEVFEVEEDTKLELNGKFSPCRVVTLSMSEVSVQHASSKGESLDEPLRVYLEGPGWVDISIIARTGRIVRAKMHASDQQRQKLIVRLFSASQGNITDTASLAGAIVALARRGFRGT
jgi:cellulose synthase (UDP-forming)